MKPLLVIINWRLIKIFFSIIIFIIILLTGQFIVKISSNLPRVPESISTINNTPPTEIYSANDYLISTIGGSLTVKLDKVSNDFIYAIIATEDHRFWEHHGVSKISLLKAIIVTSFTSEKKRGASTITQQLAKNLFFSFEKTYTRKLRELLIALQIETQFTKKEILEAYVNQISFGSGTYGIEQASNFFFEKSSADLTLSEAALLAGIPKSPTRYNPYYYPERAKKRQLLVLKRMFKSGFISKKQLNLAYETPLKYRLSKIKKRNNGYFTETVIKYLKKKYGSEILRFGGLKVYTTIDTRLQKVAESSLKNGLLKLETQVKPADNKDVCTNSDVKLQGAIVSIDVSNGAVRVMVGGRDFYKTPFNRAMQNNRQPGSAFKPFLYYAAFADGGMSPDDVIVDKKMSIVIPGAGVWTPRNFECHYKGPLIIKQAFVDSVNTVAAQLVERIGPQAVVDTAHKCGIVSNLDPVYSVALGTSGVSPFEMASAFSTFASGGIYRKPYMIRRIEDASGQILEKHTTISHNVLDPSICYQLVDMMRSVVNIGSGKIMRSMGFNMDAAGKTGTTNGYKDAWFAGFTPSLSTSVWVGFDKYYGMRYKNGIGVTGGTASVPIWSDFMLKIRKYYPSDVFKMPRNIYFSKVNSTTGRQSGFTSKNSIKVALINKKPSKKSTMNFMIER